MTVRTSCSVAANRSWPTNVERRSADSIDTRPTHARPATSTASDTATAATPGQTGPTGHIPIRPHGTVGDVGTTPTTSAAAVATSTMPSPVPSHEGSRHDAASRATPKPMHVVVTVKAAALATHAPVEPESRCAARKPTCEASDGRDEHEEPELAQHAGPSRARRRSTGASSTWRTSACSRTSGPPRHPDRSATATTAAVASPSQAAPSVATVAIWSPVIAPSPTIPATP